MTNNSCNRTIAPMGIDTIVSSLIFRLGGKPHQKMLAKVIDLRKAYKNLPLSCEALNDSYISVLNPQTGRNEAFQALVLPFGARAAVMGFCRTSYGLWLVG